MKFSKEYPNLVLHSKETAHFLKTLNKLNRLNGGYGKTHCCYSINVSDGSIKGFPKGKKYIELEEHGFSLTNLDLFRFYVEGIKHSRRK